MCQKTDPLDWECLCKRHPKLSKGIVIGIAAVGCIAFFCGLSMLWATCFFLIAFVLTILAPWFRELFPAGND